MLTLEKYQSYEGNVQSILDSGKNATTGAPIDIPKLDKANDLVFEEHFKYQETQARAHAMGIISTEVAQIIYNALGEVMNSDNGGWQDDVTLARKVSITQLMGELILKN